MYKATTLAGACVVLVLLVPQGSAVAYERPAVPDAGTYQAQSYVNSASGSGCLESSGDVFLGELSFAGLSGTTDYLRLLETGPGAAFVSVYTLTVKTGKGTTSPAGDFTWTGSGVGGSWSESGTFSGTVTEIGLHTFVLQLTVKYGSCTEALNMPLVRLGANQ